MSLKKKLLIILLPFIFILTSANAEENLKSLGKFKDWQSFVLLKEGVKTCFAQSIPVVKAPKKLKRDPSRLFVSFRPAENIKNEISVTNGYEFKQKAPISAKSGKKTYDLFSKGRFAWVVDNKDETKLITTMKKASRLMIVGNSVKGTQTTDHYSMMGFTKAYNSAKKSCMSSLNSTDGQRFSSIVALRIFRIVNVSFRSAGLAGSRCSEANA